MGHSLTLRLAPFEREALEAYGASERAPPERVVRTAVLYYLREESAKRPTWRIPTIPGRAPDPDVELEVDLPEDTAQELAEQAAAQGVGPEPLARHALLFFLADVDSGKVAKTLESILRDE